MVNNDIKDSIKNPSTPPPKVLLNQAVVSGRKIVEPISEVIIPDPIVPVADAPNNNPGEPFNDTGLLINSIEPQPPSLSIGQKIVRATIVAIGIVMFVSSFYFIWSLRVQSNPGMLFLPFGIQAVLGLGLIFRKESVRWVVFIYMVVILFENIYTLFIDGLFVLVYADLGSVLLLILGIVKLVVPIVSVSVLNMKSVKQAFN